MFGSNVLMMDWFITPIGKLKFASRMGGGAYPRFPLSMGQFASSWNTIKTLQKFNPTQKTCLKKVTLWPIYGLISGLMTLRSQISRKIMMLFLFVER